MDIEKMIEDLKSEMSNVDIEIHFDKETGEARNVVKGKATSVMAILQVLVANVIWSCCYKDVDFGKTLCIKMMNGVFRNLERNGNDDSV